jgi:DNA mismatch repair ATPase MutS
MTNNPKDFYTRRLKELDKELKEHKSRSQRIVTIRLVTVVVAIAVGVISYKQELPAFGAIVVAAIFGAFLWQIKHHNKLKALIKNIENLLSINDKELKALEGDFSDFDHGAELIDFEHRNLYDLDLFGNKTLFQRLNRTTTSEGKTALSDFIKKQDGNDLKELKALHLELAEEVLWRQDFQSVGMLAPKNKGYQELKSWFNEKPIFLSNQLLKLLSQFSPIAFVIVLVLYFIGIIPQSVPIIYFFAHLAITGVKVKEINALHGQLSKKQNNLDAYAGLLDSLANASFKNEKLVDFKNRATGGFNSINQLKRLINLLDSRLNMIMGIVLNGAFLWDYRLVFQIEKWKQEQASKLEDWISIIAKTETHCSLANYVFNHPEFVWPTESDSMLIKAQALGHPFLPSEGRISNDFELEPNGQVVLLSGANMSGKSTFLRTVGLNIIMAKLGLPVCAQSFSFKSIPVYTSMRINDSLQESESYFFAELKRLKFIMDTIKRGEEIFILMDEILRGTNSNDKHKGSAGLIKQLISLNTSGIVASHDITLSALEDEYPNKLLNRSFEVENKDGELVFDYKLRKGVCQNLNASYLMEKMGIV